MTWGRFALVVFWRMSNLKDPWGCKNTSTNHMISGCRCRLGCLSLKLSLLLFLFALWSSPTFKSAPIWTKSTKALADLQVVWEPLGSPLGMLKHVEACWTNIYPDLPINFLVHKKGWELSSRFVLPLAPWVHKSWAMSYASYASKDHSLHWSQCKSPHNLLLIPGSRPCVKLVGWGLRFHQAHQMTAVQGSQLESLPWQFESHKQLALERTCHMSWFCFRNLPEQVHVFLYLKRPSLKSVAQTDLHTPRRTSV